MTIENGKGLPLETYRNEIELDQPFVPFASDSITGDAYMESVRTAVSALLQESSKYAGYEMPVDITRQRALLKALLTMRSPKQISKTVMSHIDSVLRYESQERDVVEVSKLPSIQERYRKPGLPGELVLWRGDITRLGADAIVNAANNQMLGCFLPNHACIDNAIHSAAGPLLREDCAAFMELQGYAEPTGIAKITRAYHLPSRYVLHTVGPIIPNGESPTLRQRALLASCYCSCLSLAAELPQIRSIAFCGISTGVFGYPKREAAELAMGTVVEWLNRNPGRFDRIIFNVFGEEDVLAYERVISAWK